MSDDQKATIELLHRTIVDLRKSKSKLEDELRENMFLVAGAKYASTRIEELRERIEGRETQLKVLEYDINEIYKPRINELEAVVDRLANDEWDEENYSYKHELELRIKYAKPHATKEET